VYEGQRHLKTNFKFGTVILNTPVLVDDQVSFQELKISNKTPISSLNI
jgi:hypothetical protein